MTKYALLREAPVAAAQPVIAQQGRPAIIRITIIIDMFITILSSITIELLLLLLN